MNKLNVSRCFENCSRRLWCLLIFAGLIFGIMITSFDRDSYIYTTGISVIKGNEMTQIKIDIYRWAVGFAGSIFVIALGKLICNKSRVFLIRLIAYFGRNSLGIYILNTYVNRYFMSKLTNGFKPDVLIWLLETVLSMIIYALIIEILKRIPVARKILLGGR